MAKRSSESALEVRTRGAIEFNDSIEFMDANSPCSMVCWAACKDDGGKCATVFSPSTLLKFVWILGVVVELVTGVGMKVSSLLATLLNELNEETATSGD